MNLCVILAVLASLSVNVAFARRWSPKHQDDSGELCQSGDGSSYRGCVSKSAKGNSCLNWWWSERRLHGASKGLGHHNHCRNPDQSSGPWCRVRRGRRVVKEFCDIPRCSTPTTKPAPSADTELTCGERSNNRQEKIVGGSFTPIESHPWVAAIFHRDEFLCGGSLIAPCWVLTAAHCFHETGTTKIGQLSVQLGKNAINDTDADREQSFTVGKLIIHKKYDLYSLDNDIALMRIENGNGGCAVKSASTRTVCLPPPHTQLPPGFQCRVAGFGMESYPFGRFSQKLKQTEVNLLSQTACESELYYGKKITKNMFCAGSPDWSTDACRGDSGGPLVCDVSGRMFLFGVVSWGEGCAEENKPGVYTQVTKYNRWIGAQTGLSEYTDGVMYPEK